MSVPHTGRMIAEINGIPCRFDGDTWACDDPALAARLNSISDFIPRHHYSIQEIAAAFFDRLRLSPEQARILSWTGDAWPDDLPEGAVD